MGLLLAAALPAWFFGRVIDSLRTGRARPAFRKQAYTRKQHPRAFAITLCIWMVWGLVCLCPLVLRVHPGYDHSYYFIASFMGEHFAHHARELGAEGH